ncbi:Uncharacterized protein RNJ44_04509 [Nakaseomyces bracarensis]|uniref:Heat shock protein 70 n=1 Tax=Nakaseomyces bracarensis TaxID=273131 RepID=A0ABR4NV92_9SACH
MLRLTQQTARLSKLPSKAVRLLSSKVIGIDLGTTNSAVAYIRDSNNKKSATIIENDEGHRTTPSIVAYDKESKVIVGQKAKRQSVLNSENTFYATKRLIGRMYEDDEVVRDKKNMPYSIVKSPTSGQAYVALKNGNVKSPSEIASEVLKYLKNCAEEYLGGIGDIKKAVITVPAYFNDGQRQATKEAGKLAGLDVLRVVNEPTAAALSFGMDEKNNNGIIAVYDLGGGTFDISILDIEDGVFEVRATNGDTHLGGEDFDNVVVNHLLEKFVAENSSLKKDDIIHDRETMQRLKDAAEKAKIDLSHITETTISIPFFFESHHLNVKMTEKELDSMTMHLINRTLEPVECALRDADIEPEDVDDVILVGGMTRMPKIRSIVEELFHKMPNISVNPDETVALGAAIQGGVLSGEIKNVLLLDVTPLTLGIETFGGTFSPLILRNTTVPVKKTEVFSTGVDGQTGVDIKVYQGERGLVKDNTLIGDFKLSGIKPMSKGVPQIFVTFDIDADGIINVSALEKSTGKNESIQVVPRSGMTEEEIKKIIEDANKNRELDNQIRTKIELLNKCDIMLSDTQNIFEQYKESLNKNIKNEDLSTKLEENIKEINDLKKIVDDVKKMESEKILDVNVDMMKKDVDALQGRSLKLFQQIMTPGEK